MTSRSRWRGARAGGMWPRSWPRPGSPRIWPSRPIPHSPAAASGTPRPIRPTRGTCGCCWPRAGCRSAGSRPGHILECRALLELYNDLRRERTAWAQRIHAVLFHQGAPALGEGALRTERGVAGLRAAAAAHLSPAGQLQVATALEVIDALEVRLHEVRHQLLDAARHLAGAKALAARLYGVGPVTARAGHRAGDHLLAGRGGPVLLLPQGGPVRRAGRHRLVLRPQRPARAAVPAGTAGAALFVGTRRVRVYRCRVSPAVTACGRSGCGAAVASAFGCESGSRVWRTSYGWAGLAVSGRGAAAGRFAFSCAGRHACSCGRRVARGQSRSPGRCGLRAGAGSLRAGRRAGTGRGS